MNKIFKKYKKYKRGIDVRNKFSILNFIFNNPKNSK